MIVTISGIAGSGKSSVARQLAKALGFKHYSVGDLMRTMAEEKGVSLLKLGEMAETDESIDKELDARQVKLGKEGDNFVIDSRLGFNFIPKSVKVFLDVSLDVGAKRILEEGRKNEVYSDVAESVSKIKERIKSEDKRYKSYYDLDYHDASHYDLVVDTSEVDVDVVVGKIIDFLESSKVK